MLLTIPMITDRRTQLGEARALRLFELHSGGHGEGGVPIGIPPEDALAAMLAEMDAILADPWPGNVRELANAIEWAVIMATDEERQVEDLAVDIQTMALEPVGDLSAAMLSEADLSWLKHPWSEVPRQVVDRDEAPLPAWPADGHRRVDRGDSVTRWNGSPLPAREDEEVQAAQGGVPREMIRSRNLVPSDRRCLAEIGDGGSGTE